MIRVAIVAESPRLRSELGELLRERECFEVVASVRARDESRMHASEIINAADVVLTQVTTVASLTAQDVDDPNIAWVLLSDDDELARNLSPLRGGLALLPTTATADQIVAAIEAAAAGLTVVHPDHAPTFAPTPCDLTPREREVLHMLAAGLGNKEIASRLTISDHTAKFHVSQILGKLNAATRAEAVSIAIRRGLVPL